MPHGRQMCATAVVLSRSFRVARLRVEFAFDGARLLVRALERRRRCGVDDGGECGPPVRPREERRSARPRHHVHASGVDLVRHQRAAAIGHSRPHAVERRTEIGRCHECQRRRRRQLRPVEQRSRRIFRRERSRRPPATRISGNASRCATARRSTPDACMSASSGQVTNGESPSPSLGDAGRNGVGNRRQPVLLSATAPPRSRRSSTHRRSRGRPSAPGA